MLDRDIIAELLEHVPEEIKTLRDRIAHTEAEHLGPMLEHYRELHDHIKELKDRCAQAGHSLTVELAGRAGKRRRLMRNRRDERRACMMCGTEEIGTLATGFLSRFLLRRARWKFETLNGHISRIFSDSEWYFETLSVVRHFSFSTEVVLYHAFPPRLPSSFLNGQDEK
jgi:hypothetical protein